MKLLNCMSPTRRFAFSHIPKVETARARLADAKAMGKEFPSVVYLAPKSSVAASSPNQIDIIAKIAGAMQIKERASP
ncbi:hypothetical protein ACVWW2_002594 [Bradyrhizobium sp. LM4.3]